MKARIKKDSTGCWYYGEVYGTWKNTFGEWTGWNRVTEFCLTKWGAKRELIKYKEKIEYVEEFEL